MPRYIDANELKPDYIVPSTSTGTVSKHYVSLFQILNAPTADVVEVRRGKWIDGWTSGYDGTRHWFRVCSECGSERNDDDPEKDTNFCPNCGADMRGGDTDA